MAAHPNINRDDIKSAVYAAVDEAVDLLCVTIGIPDVDPVDAKAAELWAVAYPSRGTWSSAIRAINEGTISAAILRADVEAVLRLARHSLEAA